MDDQQGKDAAVWWLGGFIDGEGSFFFNKQRNRVSPAGHIWSPKFKVVGTDWPTLERVCAIFDEQGWPRYVEERKRPVHRDFWTVSVYGPKRMQRFCSAIIPYLHTKRSEAELLLRYCESRLSRPYESNPVRPPAYNEYELGIVERIRMLHHPQRLHADHEAPVS